MNDLLKQDLQQPNRQSLKIPREKVWKLIIILVVSFLVGILILICISMAMDYMTINVFAVPILIFISLGLYVKRTIPETWPKWYVFLTIPVVFPIVWLLSFMMLFGVTWDFSFADNILTTIIVSIPFLSFLTGIIIIYFKKNKKIIIIWVIILAIIIGVSFFFQNIVDQERKERNIIRAEEMKEMEIE